MFLRDVRDYQILFLSLFLVLGIGTRDWTIRPEFILVAIATCCTTQLLATTIRNYCQKGTQTDLDYNLPKPSFRSAIITALGLSLLLRCDHYSTMILAGLFAISSKFLFQINQKHFFNPANFGIITVLILTKDAWVSPGQWGEDWWYVLLFAGTGGMVVKRVGRWERV